MHKVKINRTTSLTKTEKLYLCVWKDVNVNLTSKDHDQLDKSTSLKLRVFSSHGAFLNVWRHKCSGNYVRNFLYSNFETAMQEFRDIRTPPSAEKNKKWCVPKSHSSAVNTTAGMGMNFLTGFTENHSLRMIRKRFPGLFCWYISFSYKKTPIFLLVPIYLKCLTIDWWRQCRH